MPALDFVELRQIHSATVYQVARDASGRLQYLPPTSLDLDLEADSRTPAGDVLVSKEAGIALAVRTADCVPLLIADARGPAIAAVHAGWRGALVRVIEKAAGELRRLFGCRPSDLLAAVGPSIRVCCYEVGEEVVEAFSGAFAGSEAFFQTPPPESAARAPELEDPARFSRQHRILATGLGKTPIQCGGLRARPALHLDLVAVARYQLLSAGLRPNNIHVADYCTACRADLFFSHRRESKSPGCQTGRMKAIIAVRPEPC